MCWWIKCIVEVLCRYSMVICPAVSWQTAVISPLLAQHTFAPVRMSYWLHHPAILPAHSLGADNPIVLIFLMGSNPEEKQLVLSLAAPGATSSYQKSIATGNKEADGYPPRVGVSPRGHFYHGRPNIMCDLVHSSALWGWGRRVQSPAGLLFGSTFFCCLHVFEWSALTDVRKLLLPL